MQFSESEIIKQLSDSRTRAADFGEIVRSNQEKLYWHVRKMVLCHDDANDILQNVFMKAWRSIDNFRGESKISTWLYRIATNEVYTFLEQRKKRNTISVDGEDVDLFAAMKADSYFDGNEAEAKLQKAILSLPEKQRLVFNMRYFDEIPYAEMEEILGTSIGALKASYHHAYKKIEQYLKEE